MIDINVLKQAIQQGVENYQRTYFSSEAHFWNTWNPFGTQDKNRAIKVLEYVDGLGENENDILMLAMAVMAHKDDGPLQDYIIKAIIDLRVFRSDLRRKICYISYECHWALSRTPSDTTLRPWAIRELLREECFSRQIQQWQEKMSAIIANLNGAHSHFVGNLQI